VIRRHATAAVLAAGVAVPAVVLAVYGWRPVILPPLAFIAHVIGW